MKTNPERQSFLWITPSKKPEHQSQKATLRDRRTAHPEKKSDSVTVVQFIWRWNRTA
jgi:hypothetical protein